MDIFLNFARRKMGVPADQGTAPPNVNHKVVELGQEPKLTVATRCANNRSLSEPPVAIDKKIVQRESKFDTPRGKPTPSDGDRAPRNCSFEETLAKSRRMTRWLESQKTFRASQTQLGELEALWSESERIRLSMLCDETKKRLDESNEQRMQLLKSLRVCFGINEMLLEKARQAEAMHAEELRVNEQSVAEATRTRRIMQGKLCQIETGLADRNKRIHDLEEMHSKLISSNETLNKALTAWENAYTCAQEKIRSLEYRIELVKSEREADRESVKVELQPEHAKRPMLPRVLEMVAQPMREFRLQESTPTSSACLLPPVQWPPIAA